MSPETKPCTKSINILVVDDTKSIRDYLCELIRAHNYNAFSCNDGKEALDVLYQHPEINLVISDIMMPNMNGIELLVEIRKKYSKHELPVILVSGQLNDTIAQQALSYGATDVFKKPFDVSSLMAAVNTQLIAARGGM